jgi:hypothetical protein
MRDGNGDGLLLRVGLHRCCQSGEANDGNRPDKCKQSMHDQSLTRMQFSYFLPTSSMNFGALVGR